MYSCLYVCTRLMPKPETHRALFKKQTKKNKRYEGTERKHGADGNPFGVLAFSFAASSRHAGRLVVLHLRFMLSRKFSLTHTHTCAHTHCKQGSENVNITRASDFKYEGLQHARRVEVEAQNFCRLRREMTRVTLSYTL